MARGKAGAQEDMILEARTLRSTAPPRSVNEATINARRRAYALATTDSRSLSRKGIARDTSAPKWEN